MKTPKQEAIEKAYGEHWYLLEENHLGDGWIENIDEDINLMDMIKDSGEEVEIRGTEKGTLKFRIKRLTGVENNLGWIRIESEEDLPKPNLNYDIVEDGLIYYDVWFTGEMWIKDPNTFNPTHWRESDRTMPIY